MDFAARSAAKSMKPIYRTLIAFAVVIRFQALRKANRRIVTGSANRKPRLEEAAFKKVAFAYGFAPPHNRTVPSLEADTRFFPSEVKATAITGRT
jgi:hypothetical protein